MFNILDVLSIAECGTPGGIPVITIGETIGAILIAVAFLTGMMLFGDAIIKRKG